MLISEKYNTRIGKYISQELVETLKITANTLRRTCSRRRRYVMGADAADLPVCYGRHTAVSVRVQYGRLSVTSPGFWLRRSMDIHSYTSGAVSVKWITVVEQLRRIHSVAKSQGHVPHSWCLGRLTVLIMSALSDGHEYCARHLTTLALILSAT